MLSGCSVSKQGYGMKSLSTLIFVLIIAILVGGGAFLVTWDIPAPSEKTERTIPDDKFPK